jgi:hypothetical protein
MHFNHPIHLFRNFTEDYRTKELMRLHFSMLREAVASFNCQSKTDQKIYQSAGFQLTKKFENQETVRMRATGKILSTF